jgi:hypothetical protein
MGKKENNLFYGTLLFIIGYIVFAGILGIYV